jgi:membrane protein
MHPVTQRLIDATPRRLRPAVRLAVATIDDAVNDRVPGLAAEIAFFVLLALPPLVLTLVGTVGYLGAEFRVAAQQRLVDIAGAVFTPVTMNEVVVPFLASLFAEGRPAVISVGFLIAIFSASRATRVVLVALAIAYDRPDARPGWQQRAYGVGLTVVGIVLGIVVMPLLVLGPRFGAVLDSWLQVEAVVSDVWQFVFWPATIGAGMLLLSALYHFGAPWTTPWRRDLPGAVLAVALWLAGSFALRTYVASAITTNPGYEPIAGPLVFLLWIYVAGFAVLLGAELNAEIEKMWPSVIPPVEDGTRTGPRTQVTT